MHPTSTDTPRALILAAGRGTRMNSPLPKVLHPLGGRPMLHYVIEALYKTGVSAMGVVCAPHNRFTIGDSRPPHPVDYIIQEKPLGTGHAVMAARPWLEQHEGPLLLVVGDAPLITPGILKNLTRERARLNAAAVFLTVRYDSTPPPWGRVIRDASGKVIGIVEEKDADYEQKKIREVSSSHYCFDTPVLLEALHHIDNHNAQNEYYLPDVIAWMIRRGHAVGTVTTDDPLPATGINTPEDLARAEALLKGISG
ncbi:MAG: hypothetical protein D6677_04795 [Calditrichaeota bacterium]|nr:MAG: hypothetical protein D6677_04795 [Calditrichota bacterium]